MALILLRHTRPEGAEGLCYGRTDLLPDAGFAKDVERLIQSLPPVTRIATSPLSRCLQLAQALCDARGLPLHIEPDLIEMDFGRWENTPWDAVPRVELDAWADDFLHARPHGGESVTMLATRARAALDTLAGPETVLAVTHAGVIKAARAATGAADPWRHETPFASWITLEWPCP